MRRSSISSFRVKFLIVDQPNTCRENSSMITARYKQPSLVQIYVMSEYQAGLESFTRNCRSSRLEATGKLYLLSVFVYNFSLFCRYPQPCSSKSRLCCGRMSRLGIQVLQPYAGHHKCLCIADESPVPKE